MTVVGIFKVEEIVGMRTGSDGSIEYEVKWQGYPDDNTWEPLSNLVGCHERIFAFFQKNMNNNS